MLSRREGLKLAGALGVAGLSSGSAWSQGAADAPTVKTAVSFAVPEGAADCHVHVIADPATFPFWPGRIYTPPVATADDLLALQHALHMDHVVIVTPSVYGTDNSATLDGLRRLGPQRARGIAVIDDKTPTADLDTMAKAGVCGIRSTSRRPGSSTRRRRRRSWRRRSRNCGIGPGIFRCTLAPRLSQHWRNSWNRLRFRSCSTISPAPRRRWVRSSRASTRCCA